MVSIFVDTNILHSSEQNYTKIRFIDNLQKMVSDIEVNDIYSDVQIVIPKIVIHELYQQQIEDYYEQMQKLKFLTLPNWEIDRNFDYEGYLSGYFREEIQLLKNGLVHIEIVDFPEDSAFENIIMRAINKKAPFEGKTKKSDKGFKDAIFWESLIEYKRKHSLDTIVLYCNDNRMTDEALSEEYKKEFHDNLYISKKDELMECLSKILNVKFERTFSGQLEDRLSELLNEKNVMFYEMMMEDSEWSNGTIIKDFIVKQMTIDNCDDEVHEGKIKYNIILDLSSIYDDEQCVEDYKLGGKYEFIIFYDFDEDEFLMSEYDVLTKGRLQLYRPLSLYSQDNVSI